MRIWISRVCQTLTDIFTTISAAAAAMSPVISLGELAAVVLSLAYLILAIRQNILCWPAAILSCIIYIVIMYDAGLYMESVLQLFYIGMAVYGWVHWARGRGRVAGGSDRQGQHHAELRVVDWPVAFHFLPLLVVALLTALSGAWLSANTEAAYAYLDSFTTWGAIVATWMVARKVLQNWHYWLVIDSVALYLYFNRELYLTAVLFCVYIALIFIGYQSWRKSMRKSGVPC